MTTVIKDYAYNIENFNKYFLENNLNDFNPRLQSAQFTVKKINQ